MPACEFELSIGNRSPAAFIAAARSEISSSQGASLSGDERSGSFVVPTPAGSIAGSYSQVDATFLGQYDTRYKVVVDKKPVFIPCSAIEKQFVEAIGTIPDPGPPDFTRTIPPQEPATQASVRSWPTLLFGVTMAAAVVIGVVVYARKR